ncbi:MAG: phenylacetate-CoA oxygenase subunit PaaJ [Rhodobacteraceae bacterium]|nr:phenylacetate-CoA oxygenase subunit PaaJ [Paracoccaceae bacterium]
MVSEAQIWAWLDEVPDPEIPVLSLVDLGVIRGVEIGEEVVIKVTPTYSGCPATSVINLDITEKLRANGVKNLRLEPQIYPPWSTDWIKREAHEKLRAYGIAPPVSGTALCPRCASANTEMLSKFGSTPCKSHHRCKDCLEPFDAFKCL